MFLIFAVIVFLIVGIVNCFVTYTADFGWKGFLWVFLDFLPIILAIILDAVL